MKRISTMIAFALLCACTPAVAQTNLYGWTISDSNSNPFSNTGPVPGAPLTLYLWLDCVTNDGMSAMEADFSVPAGVSVFGFNPTNGFLNAGNSTYLLLAVGGCPGSAGGTAIPLVAGSWSVFGAVAGSYCLVPSGATGTLGTVDCSITPAVWPIRQVGYGTGGAPSCDQSSPALCVTAVEGNSWGAVKSLYR